MGQLTLERRIKVFKFIAASKIIYLLLIRKLHNYLIDLLHKIQKNVTWQAQNANIKHKTLCNSYEKGGLENNDLTIYVPTPQNGQTPSNNSLAIADKLFEWLDNFVELAPKWLRNKITSMQCSRIKRLFEDDF